MWTLLFQGALCPLGPPLSERRLPPGRRGRKDMSKKMSFADFAIILICVLAALVIRNKK